MRAISFQPAPSTVTAFVKPGTEPRVGIVSDFVSTPLTDFVRLLVKTYLQIPPVETKLGYAGSDHASWTKVGVPSAFAIEGESCSSMLVSLSSSQVVTLFFGRLQPPLRTATSSASTLLEVSMLHLPLVRPNADLGDSPRRVAL